MAPKTLREAKVGNAFVRLVQNSNGSYSGIVTLDGAIKSRVEGENLEDLWRRLHDEAAKVNPKFFGFDGARSRFLRIFGQGFNSPQYADNERNYKVAAKRKLDEAAPVDQAASDNGFAEAALTAFRATNLLSPFEKTRIQAVLRGPMANQFVQGAAMFTQGETKQALLQMERALKANDVAKWTAVTYLPFLWRPDRHMFLKPEVTQNFADRVGHRFSRDYEPALNYDVYSSLLDLTTTTERELTGLKPADRIDVQSFIWVVGEYGVEAEAGLDKKQ